MTDWTVWRLSRTQEALARRSDVEVALVYAESPRGCRACGAHPGFAHSEPQHVRAYAGEDGAVRDFVWPGPGGRDLSQVFVAPRVEAGIAIYGALQAIAHSLHRVGAVAETAASGAGVLGSTLANPPDVSEGCV